MRALIRIRALIGIVLKHVNKLNIVKEGTSVVFSSMTPSFLIGMGVLNGKLEL